MTAGLSVVGEEFYYLAATKAVKGASVTATRPANAVAYAAGQVYGAAGDARLQLVVPALPGDAQSLVFTAVQLLAIQSREPAAAALNNLQLSVRQGAFTTVLGDQAAFALNDADIAAIVTTSATGANLVAASFNTGTTGGTLNAGAGIAGRRATAVQLAAAANLQFLPGAVLGLYLFVVNAWAPIANEFVRIRPYWVYPAKAAI